ncbi:MAG: hydroxyethylthiazole kinase [Marivibrio sp.]|uniref:hydroxyethylthiazole kinase n=1 Tax=Marivibrio sp. TaxID=2039719 RepID=UPI0032ED80EC
MPLDAPADRLRAAANALERLRAAAPRVHVLTNVAAATLSANALLALGATPSLTDDPDETGDFVRTAGALAVNLGTPDPRRDRAIETAVDAAGAAKIPWLLDPVMIERAPARLAAARRLTARGPAVLRLNEAERAALFDGAQAPRYHGCLAVSGQTDQLRLGDRRAAVANGTPLFARTTGTGCALGAATAAFLAVEADPLQAALAGALAFGIAGELAAERAPGPGGFPAALLDALAALDPETVQTRGRIA